MQRRPAATTKDARVSLAEDSTKPAARPVGASKTIQCAAVLYALLATCLLTVALSLIWTDSYTFGYKPPNWRKYIPREERLFTPEQLREYDGTDPTKPVYLAILGRVFDVSEGQAFYGKKSGGYSFFAGRDGSRSFVTGCFEEKYMTHDLRGLTEKERKSVEEWASFYDNHPQYFYVGRVQLPSIDPDAPLPLDCRPPKPEPPIPEEE